MLQQHNIDAEDLKKWLCVKDGRTHNNTGTPGSRFQNKWASHIEGVNHEDGEEESEADIEDNDQEDEDPDCEFGFGKWETSYIRPDAEGKEGNVICIPCNTALQPRSILRHFTKKDHGIKEADVKTWAIVKDGHMQKNGYGIGTDFPQAWAAMEEVRARAGFLPLRADDRDSVAGASHGDYGSEATQYWPTDDEYGFAEYTDICHHRNMEPGQKESNQQAMWQQALWQQQSQGAWQPENPWQQTPQQQHAQESWQPENPWQQTLSQPHAQETLQPDNAWHQEQWPAQHAWQPQAAWHWQNDSQTNDFWHQDTAWQETSWQQERAPISTAWQPASTHQHILTINEDAMNWSHDMHHQGHIKHYWPIETSLAVDLQGFRRWLEAKGNVHSTTAGHMAMVRNFFSLFQAMDNSECTALEAISSIYNAGIIPDVFAFPIMDASYPWTCKMMFSLKQLRDHLIIECNRLEQDATKRCVERFHGGYCIPKRKASCKYLAAKKHQKKQRDEDVVENMATIPELKQAVSQSMVDLKVAEHCLENYLFPECNWHYRTSIAMVGIIFCGAQAGRPGEWALLSKSLVRIYSACVPQ